MEAKYRHLFRPGIFENKYYQKYKKLRHENSSVCVNAFSEMEQHYRYDPAHIAKQRVEKCYDLYKVNPDNSGLSTS